jgi:hypothetical protein
MDSPLNAVQNSRVTPILVTVKTGRRKRAEVKEAWRESAESALREWLERYCADWQGKTSELQYVCPHGCRVNPFAPGADHEPIQCDACNGWSTAERRGKLYVVLYGDSPRLRRFPRSGDVFLDKEDHYISLYDDHLRVYRDEYPHGRRRAGGIAVRAKLGFGGFTDSEGFEGFRSFGHRYTAPDFNFETGDWEQTEETNGLRCSELTYLRRLLRRCRSTVSVRQALPSDLLHDHSPAILDVFRTDQRTVVDVEDKLYRRCGSYDYNDVLPTEPPRELKRDLPSYWRYVTLPDARRTDEQTQAGISTPRSGQGWPFVVQAEDARWRSKYWISGKPFTIAPEVIRPAVGWKAGKEYEGIIVRVGNHRVGKLHRRVWPDGWRDERKMCDLDAKLKLVRYGDSDCRPKPYTSEHAQELALNELRDKYEDVYATTERHQRKLGKQKPHLPFRETVRTPFETVKAGAGAACARR